jgi:hypothetical protein
MIVIQIILAIIAAVDILDEDEVDCFEGSVK